MSNEHEITASDRSLFRHVCSLLPSVVDAAVDEWPFYAHVVAMAMPRVIDALEVAEARIAELEQTVIAGANQLSKFAQQWAALDAVMVGHGMDKKTMPDAAIAWLRDQLNAAETRDCRWIYHGTEGTSHCTLAGETAEERKTLLKERDSAREALRGLLKLPQSCNCSPQSGCGEAISREIARAALAASESPAPAQSGLFQWERHGDGWALYQGRDTDHHGYNIITVPDEGFDARGASWREIIAEMLNERYGRPDLASGKAGESEVE